MITPSTEKPISFLERYRDLLMGSVLVTATIVVYVPAIRGGFIWDDDEHVTANQTLRSTGGLSRIWFEVGAVPQYYPLVHTTFWIEYQLWGIRPVGFHLVNVLLHAASAIVLWQILRLLGFPFAWFAAAVFALHPVHVESVAWISERKNTLSGLLYLSAALTYLRCALGTTAPAAEKNAKWRLYSVSVLLFIGAVLSKTVTVSLPAALALIVFWKRGRLSKNDILPLAAMFLVGLPFGLLTVWMEQHNVGATGQEWNLSPIERCLVAGRAVWFYFGKLIWPAQLTFIYPRWHIDDGNWWQYLFPASAIVAIAGLWLARRSVGSAPLVAVLFFVGTLAPALGFFDIFPMRYSFIADHFQYLASIGMIALVTGTAHVVLNRSLSNHKWLRYAAGLCVLSVLGILSWQQCHIYKDRETLWRDTIRKDPKSAIAHTNLGKVLSDRGRHVEAIDHYRQALQTTPDDRIIYYNMGVALQHLGRVDEAVDYYREAIHVDPRRREYVAAHANLAILLNRRGRYSEAELHFIEALRVDPNNATVHYNFGILLSRQQRTELAVRHFRKAISLNPTNSAAHTNLGNLLLERGQAPEAAHHYQQAIRFDPRNVAACVNLGRLKLLDGMTGEAVELFRQAINADPKNVVVHNALGVLLLELGDRDSGIGHLREAIRLNPDFQDARRNLERATGE